MILTWLLKVKGSEGTGLALDCTERKFATKKAHFACLGISEYLQAEPKPFGVPPVRLPLLQLLLFFSLLLSLSLLLLLLAVSNCLILVATFWPLVTSSFPILSLKISPLPSLIVTSALAKSLCEEQFLFPYPRIKSAEHHGLFNKRESHRLMCAQLGRQRRTESVAPIVCLSVVDVVLPADPSDTRCCLPARGAAAAADQNSEGLMAKSKKRMVRCVVFCILSTRPTNM